MPDNPVRTRDVSLVWKAIGIVIAVSVAIFTLVMSVNLSIERRPTTDAVQTMGDSRWCAISDCVTLSQKLVTSNAMFQQMREDLTEIKTDIRSTRDTLTEILRTIPKGK